MQSISFEPPTSHAVIVEVSGYSFGIDMRTVVEVARCHGTPHQYMTQGGQTVPVVDLRSLLKKPTRRADEDARLLVVRSEGALLGILADKVTSVLSPGHRFAASAVPTWKWLDPFQLSSMTGF